MASCNFNLVHKAADESLGSSLRIAAFMLVVESLLFSSWSSFLLLLLKTLFAIEFGGVRHPKGLLLLLLLLAMVLDLDS